MRVVTLNTHNFDKECQRLRNTLNDYDPDLVIAIPTGGRYVADAMFPDKNIVEISLQRDSTQQKKHNAFLQWLMENAPYSILDAMRICESYVLQWLVTPKCKNIDQRSITTSAISAISVATNIIIVDDAIDSGVTADAVARVVRAVNPKASIKIAVITVTTPNPLVKPDFTLYNNRTLIRFPWSMDMKK